MTDDYYRSLAEGIACNIHDKTSRTKCLSEVALASADELDQSVADEVLDSIYLSELAAAMGSNYALARYALTKFRTHLSVYLAACNFIAQDANQVRERIGEIFIEVISPILKQLDNNDK